MDINHKLVKQAGMCILSVFVMTSCVNRFSEENDFIDDGDFSLRLVADIQSASNTRVADNSFEDNDEVGVFALLGSSMLNEERYADNMHFVRNSSKVFESSAPIYFPDDKSSLHIISYYPYQKKGVPAGASTLPVQVKADQTTQPNYSQSDFLVASLENVAPSKEPIALAYDHKLFNLKISLIFDEEVDLQPTLEANPQLSLCGLFTKADYDFQENNFFGFSNECSIIPSGEWKVSDGRLVGKQAILIPQEIMFSYHYISLHVGEKIYTSLLPSTLKLQSGIQRELEITFRPAEDVLISRVSGEINNWGDGDPDQSGSEIFHNYIDVSKLTFDDSNVCKVLSGGQQVAEICKEYLVTPNLTSQAIIIYPMKADHTVDLKKGTVVKLLGCTEKIHGGSISWDMEEHSLTYTPGTMSAINKVFVLPDGQIALSMPASGGVLPVLVKGDIMRDVRGGSIYNYPIVKIGTQYWMRSNLSASLYTDGEGIPKLAIMDIGTTGYLQSATQDYFYSFGTIVTNKLIPENWSLPDWSDWNILKTYLKGDASQLKSGTWIAIGTGDNAVVSPATNLTGFNGIPIGMYVGEYQSSYEGKYLSYWTLDASGTGVDEKIVLFRSDNNEISQGKMGLDKAYAIRCIRK